MNKREEAMKELTLALIYLTRFQDLEGYGRHDEIAWENYDFDIIHSLDEDGFIIEPKQKHGHSKYVWLTNDGRQRAKEILKKYEIPDDEIYERFTFRSIQKEEWEEAARIEEVCFPPNEACTPDMMRDRIQTAPELFLVAAENETGKIAGFLNGLSSDEMIFRDEFFTNAALYEPDGRNVFLLGLDVLPEYQNLGLARELVFQYCRREEERGRKRLVLTCHANKVKMYRKFGFRDLGESESEWGGEKWHEMDYMLAF